VLVLATLIGLAPLLKSTDSSAGPIEIIQAREATAGVEPPAVKIPFTELLALLHEVPRIENGSIPRILHQSYKSTELPADFKKYQQSWFKNQPSWVYQFWTDDDNRMLVQVYFPWFLETYDALPQKIMRPDAVR
jgi:hypothetical protein